MDCEVNYRIDNACKLISNKSGDHNGVSGTSINNFEGRSKLLFVFPFPNFDQPKRLHSEAVLLLWATGSISDLLGKAHNSGKIYIIPIFV